MTATGFTVGALVVGGKDAPRRLVRHADLLAAYADGTQIDRGHTGEAYLSHFVFGPDYRDHHRANRGSVAGYAGPCGCRWLVLDLDRPDPAAALTDARRLVAFLHQRYPEAEGAVPIWFSGWKGFHVAVELAHDPPPAVGFPLVARTLAEQLARTAGVVIDTGVYDTARIIRLPNTRHPKTGLFKRLLGADDLFRVDVAGVLAHARHPAGDGLPAVPRSIPQLAADWHDAERVAASASAARAAVRRDAGPAEARAPRFLVDFLRFGVDEGERHAVLFRCAAWLAEQGASPSLCHALLTEPGCDVGLAPRDVTRQIACGVDHARRQRGDADDPRPDPAVDPDGFERWAIRREADPLPPGALDFPFGALAPAGGGAA